MENICNNCKGMVVMHAFSFGNCAFCGEDVSTPHIPCYRYCDECAENKSICKQCGNELEE